MKIAKATEILSDSLNRGMTTFNADWKDAQQLAIQALIRHQNRHHLTFSGMLQPLTGETPESTPQQDLALARQKITS